MKAFKISKRIKYELVGVIDVKDMLSMIHEHVQGSVIRFSGGLKPFNVLVKAMNWCLPQGQQFTVRHGSGYSWIHCDNTTRFEIDGNILGIYVITESEDWFIQ